MKQIIIYSYTDGYMGKQFFSKEELKNSLDIHFTFAIKKAKENNYPDLQKIVESYEKLNSDIELDDTYYYRSGKTFKISKVICEIVSITPISGIKKSEIENYPEPSKIKIEENLSEEEKIEKEKLIERIVTTNDCKSDYGGSSLYDDLEDEELETILEDILDNDGKNSTLEEIKRIEENCNLMTEEDVKDYKDGEE